MSSERISIKKSIALNAFSLMQGLILAGLIWLPTGFEQIGSIQILLLWLLPILWAISKTRFQAALVVFGYYLVVSRDVPAMSQSFTSLSLFHAWLLIFVYAGLIAALWAVAWQKRPAYRVAGLCVVLLIMSVPPLGGYVVGSPFMSTGILFPGWGFRGILATVVSWCVAIHLLKKNESPNLHAKRHCAVFMLIFGTVALNVNLTAKPQNPIAIKAVNTNFDRYPKNLEQSYQRQVQLSEIALKAINTLYPVVALPEAVAGHWEPRMQWLWQDVASQYKAVSKTLVLGVEVVANDKATFTNTAKFMGQHTGEVHARVPALVGSWHPWLIPHGPMRWFDTSAISIPNTKTDTINGKAQADRNDVAVFFCWEELVPWPWIWMGLQKSSQPTTALILVNHWFTKGLDVGDTQERSSRAWARLFGWPVVRVVNASTSP